MQFSCIIEFFLNEGCSKKQLDCMHTMTAQDFVTARSQLQATKLNLLSMQLIKRDSDPVVCAGWYKILTTHPPIQVTGDVVQSPHESRILEGYDWLQQVLDIDFRTLPHTLDHLDNWVR